MTVSDAFEEIIQYAHFWNWAPDWQVVKEIYGAFPNSYSVLSPFAYSYLEELIRSTTSEYGIITHGENEKQKMRKVGLRLMNLAIEENNKNSEYIKLLEEMKVYFSFSKPTDEGDNRNSVVHGFMHPRFWNKESFEKLVFDIASLSKFARF